jgi:hypothetical protein
VETAWLKNVAILTAINPHAYALSKAYANLGSLAEAQADLSKAASYLEHALAIQQTAHQPQDYAITLNNLAIGRWCTNPVKKSRGARLSLYWTRCRFPLALASHSPRLSPNPITLSPGSGGCFNCASVPPGAALCPQLDERERG